MNQNQLLKQMIDFNKTAFDNAFNTMTLLQEQAERTTHTCLEQAAWLPQEGRTVVDTWMKACKDGRESFRSAIDDNFKKIEAYFV